MKHYYKPNNNTVLETIINELREAKSPLEVSIHPAKRTTPQNALFHNNLQLLCQHTGYTLDEAKAIIKTALTQQNRLSMLTEKETKVGKIILYRSTADLDTKEYQILIDYLFQVMGHMDIRPKYPDEVYDPVSTAKQIFS